MKQNIINKFLLLVAISMLGSPLTSGAYSVLTHEAIVDALWEKSIQPLLKQKYPGVTEEQLKEAHSYAYGGAIAPDMGYFPFGSRLFTNLVHYVRSGDFVNALLDDVQDVNEYAFALGFLSHYMADKYGHFLGTNRCVPLVYPEMMTKYGKVVTYGDDKISHGRMEFAFDVLQTANGNYASKSYHDFIGFNVSRSLLERAFRKTYGLEINKIFVSFSLAVNVFRWSVTSLFPVITKSAWAIRKDEILKLQPTATSRSFRYKMSMANYYQELGKKHERPGLLASSLSLLIRVLPKIGPLKTLKIKEPGPTAEKYFIQSFDSVLADCTSSMKNLGAGNINLINIDFDTGNPTAPGEYKLADICYGSLLLKLRKKKFNQLSDSLKLNIIGFYSSLKPTTTTQKSRKEWEKIMQALEQLKISPAQKF
jgi:hypothetical protein